MSLPIHLDEYSSHKANVSPRNFVLDEEIYEIVSVLDQWYEPSATYFKVQTTQGKMYLLRYGGQVDEWTLQSGFDGAELMTRPSIDSSGGSRIWKLGLERSDTSGVYAQGQSTLCEI